MTALTGPEFFEEQETHAAHQACRNAGYAPNEVIEQRIFDEILGDVRGLDVYDLGCGDGRSGLRLIERGCRSYLGIDASSRMVELARQANSGSNSHWQHARIEDLALPLECCDLVVSRMTFHWIANIDTVFARIFQALRPGDRFVFSVEHPILTSCDSSRVDGKGRTSWLVDDYFIEGWRSLTTGMIRPRSKEQAHLNCSDDGD